MRRRTKIVCTTAALSGLSAAAIGGAAALAQQAVLEPTLTVTETYSDNVDRDPRSQREDAFLTDVRPGATLRWTGNRVTAALDAATTFRHQTAGEDKGVSVLPDVAGLGSAELWQDHLFFDASAVATTELLNTQQEDTEANRSIVQTYTASPRLLGSFGNFADATLNYTFTQTLESGGNTEQGGGTGGNDEGDSQTHAVGASLSAGPEFTRARWSLSGSASEEMPDEGEDTSRREASLGLEYIVDRSFSLLGGAGYQSFDDGDEENDIDGPTWDAGFRWRPGSRTDITVTYGRTDDRNSLNADARYQITPRTSAFVTYQEVLETGQERRAGDLDFIGTDPNTGALIDTRTGLPFDAQTNITTVDDDTQRTKTLSVGVSGTRGRNTFALTGQAEFTRDVGSIGPNDEEDAYSVIATWGRQLSPRANLSTRLSYDRNEFQLQDRTDNEYGAGVTYRYNIYQNINAFGDYDFGVQTSNDKDEEFLENRVLLGLTVSF